MAIVAGDVGRYIGANQHTGFERFQDYVIVHELLHLRYSNHGRMFKALMSAHVLNWRGMEAHQRSV